jgi:UDPglucose 6-dehydrogenase
MTPGVLSVVGLGKIGAPMLAAFAAAGYRVIGVDVNEHALQMIEEGRSPVPEPEVEALLRAHRDRIAVRTDCAGAVVDSDLTFVAVPTPSEPDGTYSLAYVRGVCEAIGGALARKPAFHVVVVTSTVLPQDMESHVRPLLEARSGKACGQGFGLCYSPEFVALGSVIRDIRRPDFVLIGESDARSGGLLEGVYRRLVGDGPPVVRTNFVNAELAKIAVNTFVTTKISYANMLAEVCERLPGADVDAVTDAIGLDRRIGPRYLRGRLGYGGPCFPRDNIAMSAMARRYGVEATLADATDAVNRRQVGRLLAQLRPLVAPGDRAGVLGLTYTPNTDVVEQSQGLALASSLAGTGRPVIVYDPLGMPAVRRVLGDAVEYAASAAECIERADVVVIATPWEEFRRLRPEQFRRDPPRTVLDCWRLLPAEGMARVSRYLTVGRYHPAHAGIRPPTLSGP